MFNSLVKFAVWNNGFNVRPSILNCIAFELVSNLV